MPTGFNVPSGSSLSAKLIPVAHRLAEYLRKSRQFDQITPDNPKTAAELVEIGADAGLKLEGPTIRAMVNYLRINRHPVGSNGNGYFWAIKREELNPTLIHMMERISAIQHAVTGLEQSFPPDGQRNLL
jgi:hypothetical protein